MSINGLVAPADFPVTEFESIFSAIGRLAQSAINAHGQFAGAWNGLAYRFAAVAELEAALAVSLPRSGAFSVEERYQQERDLFAFFSNTFSVLESVFYGLYSVGAIISPPQ